MSDSLNEAELTGQNWPPNSLILASTKLYTIHKCNIFCSRSEPGALLCVTLTWVSIAFDQRRHQSEPSCSSGAALYTYALFRKLPRLPFTRCIEERNAHDQPSYTHTNTQWLTLNFITCNGPVNRPNSFPITIRPSKEIFFFVLAITRTTILFDHWINSNGLQFKQNEQELSSFLHNVK